MKTNDINPDGTNRLVALSDIKDYKVAKDSPDVSGWRLIGANGESLGMVKDLIVDLEAMKTRYLSVLADRKFFNASDDQYLLIPIGAAALDKRNRKVFVSHLDANSIAHYPVYPGGPIREDYEYDVRDHFQQNSHPFVGNAPAASTTATTNTITETPPQNIVAETNRAPIQEPPVTRRAISNDFYDNQHYNENQFYTSNHDTPNRDSTILYNSSQDTDRETKEIQPVNTSIPVQNTNTSSDTSFSTGNPKSVEESIATIERLEQLRERGTITDEEFRALKKKAINY